MKTKTIKTKQYLAIVQSVKDCVAGLKDSAVLNPQRIADDIIARCDGDGDKVTAALEAHRKQQGEAARDREPTIVEVVLSKRLASHTS